MGMGDVFKLFVSAGSLCLRKNREAETHYDNWTRCGETWAMNPGDMPHFPSAMESSYERRLRRVRMRARFTSLPTEVGPEGKNIPIIRHSEGLGAAPRCCARILGAHSYAVRSKVAQGVARERDTKSLS